MEELADIQIKYKLSRTMAKALRLLIERQRVLPAELKQELETVLDAKMIIHKLRKKLKVFGISIQSRRDVGYWLDDAAREALLKELAADSPAGLAGESVAHEKHEDHHSDDKDHTS